MSKENENKVLAKSADTMDKVIGTMFDDMKTAEVETQGPEHAKSMHKFQPVGQTVPKTPEAQIQTADVDLNIEARIKLLTMEIEKLKNGNKVRLAKTTNEPPKIDFAKISEQDVFNLDIPIQAIAHDLPDTMAIRLKDPAYVGRWVNCHVQRLGSMKAVGFTFVTPEDLLEPLKLEIDLDENGQYRYNDVVAMKILKEKYFAQLRANHLRSIAVVNPQKAKERGKKIVEGMYERESDEEFGSVNASYQKYRNEGKLDIFV